MVTCESWYKEPLTSEIRYLRYLVDFSSENWNWLKLLTWCVKYGGGGPSWSDDDSLALWFSRNKDMSSVETDFKQFPIFHKK